MISRRFKRKDETMLVEKSNKVLKIVKISLRGATEGERSAAHNVARQEARRRGLDLEEVIEQARRELCLVPKIEQMSSSCSEQSSVPTFTYNRMGQEPSPQRFYRANGATTDDVRKYNGSDSDRATLTAHIRGLLAECGFVKVNYSGEETWAFDMQHPTNPSLVIRSVVRTTIEDNTIAPFASGTIRVYSILLNKITRDAIGWVHYSEKLPGSKIHNLSHGVGRVRRCGHFGEIRMRLYDALRRCELASLAKARGQGC